MAKTKSEFAVDMMVLCDYSVFAQDGKFSVMGIFDRLFVTQVPATHPKMVIASIVSGPPGGQCEYVLEFVEPDGKLSQNKAVSMNVKLGPSGKGNVASEYHNLLISGTGEYTVRLKLNGVLVKELPLYVQKVNTNEGEVGKRPVN